MTPQSTLLEHDNPIPQATIRNPLPIKIIGPENCNFVCESCPAKPYRSCFGGSA
ncbi:MAG: hypothetical protein M0Q91_13300 [Methanoregula sp.]|nr:hypothetical protein [Methanoregula sp.]